MSLKRRSMDLHAVANAAPSPLSEVDLARVHASRNLASATPELLSRDRATKRCRGADAEDAPSSSSSDDDDDAAARELARAHAARAGHVELATLLRSLRRGVLDAATETKLVHLNLAVGKHAGGRIFNLVLKSSHSWSRNDPSTVLAHLSRAFEGRGIGIGIGGDDADARLMGVLRHLLEATYPTAASVAAAEHVFDASGDEPLRGWCARHGVDATRVAVLEVLLYDASGAASNALCFPLSARS